MLQQKLSHQLVVRRSRLAILSVLFRQLQNIVHICVERERTFSEFTVTSVESQERYQLIKTMRYLIGGGSGFIGSQLCKHLRTKGHEVIVISRTPGQGKITWDDLKKSRELPECDGVVNLAGENILNAMRRWNASYKDDVRTSRIGTNEIIVSCLKNAKTPPSVFVATSAVGYYPPSDVKTYDESYNAKPSNFLEQLVHDAERSSMVPSEDSPKVRQAIVRVGVVLGKTGGVIEKSIWPFWLGLGGRIGSGTQSFPWIHVDDIVGIYTFALENEQVHGVLNGVAPDLCDNATFTKEFASALWRPAIFPMPEFVLNTIFSPERARILCSGQKVLPTRTLELGYDFLFSDLKSAVKNIVQS